MVKIQQTTIDQFVKQVLFSTDVVCEYIPYAQTYCDRVLKLVDIKA